ncbi:MAG: response regulator transcription factor [Acidobacteria bacterium]|nr:response regulator transcription factor [Acidobacteriota bacterium]
MNILVESRIRLVIADDHEVVREGISAILSHQPDMRVVGMASTGPDAVSLCGRREPDVALLDLHMPQTDGVETIKQIGDVSPQTRIVVVTVYDGDEYVRRAIKAGAISYVLKSAPREDLLLAVRKAHLGLRHLSGGVVDGLAATRGEPVLTPREREVMELIAEGLSNHDVAVALNVTLRTAKAHATSIFRKLVVTDRTQALRVALRRGIVRWM